MTFQEYLDKLLNFVLHVEQSRLSARHATVLVGCKKCIVDPEIMSAFEVLYTDFKIIREFSSAMLTLTMRMYYVTYS